MTDETQLPELTSRQEELLSLLVRAYTQRPEPVSSKTLCETFNLAYSTATVRNELAVLEELGYLKAPHTSAGRVPTETGYRYFVRRLLPEGDLPAAERTYLAEKFNQMPLALEGWLRGAAAHLARLVNAAALVTPPAAETNRFQHVELIGIQGRLALMVLVLQGGTVLQQMLTLAEAVAQPQLSETANRLNAVCAGLAAHELGVKRAQFGALERDVLDLAAEMMRRADGNAARIIYRDGLSDAITTFGDQEAAQQALRVFEERAYLDLIFNDVLGPLMNQVQVVIAGNGRWEELRHLSMVVARYGVPGQVSGALGVLGPTHLDYARAVGAVGAMSALMTGTMQTIYAEPATAHPALPTPDDD